jgi:hypothetical protein
MALGACVLATLAACGQAFTSSESGDGGGEDASSDSPGAGEGSSGDDATGDAGADAIGHDAPAHDGPSMHDAPASEGAAEGGIGDVVVGSPKLVFITSQLYNGNLGGLLGADGLCQKLAGQASRPGVFKAWLSSTLTSAAERLTHSTGPYVLPNGTPVAANWAGLTSGTLLSPIDLTETGANAPSPTIMCGSTNVPAAWTATAPDGTLGTTLKATCGDWTTSGQSNGAILGVADQTGAAWTAGCSSQTAAGTSTICGQTASLYCIEQ